jgi:hypothetical protein
MSQEKSKTPSKCEQCHHELPFGEFELTKKSTGAPKNAKWSVRFNCYVQVVRRYLCAQCGFNITSLRVVRRYEVPERVETGSGATSVRVREIIAQDRPYLDCVLIAKIETTFSLANAEQKARYHEQVAALEAQRRARRASMYERRLRAIGQTIRDQERGIMPLTEEEIEEAMYKYTNGSSLGSGSARGQVQVVVVGNVLPRRGVKPVPDQRVSSASTTVVATPASRVLPRVRS